MRSGEMFKKITGDLITGGSFCTVLPPPHTSSHDSVRKLYRQRAGCINETNEAHTVKRGVRTQTSPLSVTTQRQ